MMLLSSVAALAAFTKFTSSESLASRSRLLRRDTVLGGVWRQNVYPGARVDSDVPVYQLWIEERLRGL